MAGFKDQINDVRNLGSEFKKFADDAASTTQEAILLSQIYDDVSKTVTNIRSTLRETKREQHKISVAQEKLNRYRQIEYSIQEKLNKSAVYRALHGDEELKKVRNLMHIQKGLISQAKEKMILNEEIDTMYQRYIKNQEIISLLEWDMLYAAQKYATVFRITLSIIADTLKRFNAIDKTVTSLRHSFGLLPDEGHEFYTITKDIVKNLSDLGITSEEVGKSILAIQKTFGGLLTTNTKLIKTASMLQKSFGISAEISLKFSKSLAEISGSTTESTISMTGFAKSMASASNVPLDDILKDVAELSNDTRLYIKGSTAELVKAVTEARRLGTTLSSITDTAQKMLSFESSIQSELKASALIGKSISFNESRRLFFQGKLIEGNNEILKIAKQVKFNELNPIQMQAFADAAGKSVGELQSILQREKDIAYLKANGTKEDMKLISSYEKLKNMSEDRAKSEGERAREELMRINNQERMAALQAQFNKLIYTLQDPLLTIAESFMSVIVPLSTFIPHIAKMGPIIMGIAKLFGGMFLKFFEKLPKYGRMFSIFAKKANFIQKMVGPLLIYVGKIGAMFARVLGPIGLVITGLQFVNSLMKRWSETPKGILGGLEAIGLALYDVIISPFYNAYKWIEDKLMGHSPSKIGLGIVKGIKSVGSMLLAAIIQPFINGYNWIQNSFIGKLLPGGSIDNPVLFGNSSATITNSSSKNQQLEDIKVSNELVVRKLDELITLMSTGGIAVNLDGTKLNSALATATNRRGYRGEPTTL